MGRRFVRALVRKKEGLKQTVELRKAVRNNVGMNGENMSLP